MTTTQGLPQKDRIPTLNRLRATLPDTVESNASLIAEAWFKSFSSFIESGDVAAVLGLLCDDALWRDAYALTWDIRTLDGTAKIKPCLENRLPIMSIHSFKWKEFVRFQRPYPDLAWILAMFGFETNVGECTAVVRLVPTEKGNWKACTIFTNLDDLKAFPEMIGPLRQQHGVPGLVWKCKREEEAQFASSTPSVIIVGAGHSGLSLAARLKYLKVSSLVVEKNERIGDSWRKRYDALCLHFPIWYDNMPYLPCINYYILHLNPYLSLASFPVTWPKYTPGLKFADWLEYYAGILELNVWTSSEVLGATQQQDETWSVQVRKENGDFKTFRVNHFVIATGQGDSLPRMLDIPNMDTFRGELLHSSMYKRTASFEGKKVVVIGSGNSGHDISADLARANIDVTVYQRSPTLVMNLDKAWKFLGGALYSEGSPPNFIADLLQHSMPHLLLEGGMSQRGTKAILNDQKDLQDGLRNAGFKLNAGILDAGILLNLKQKRGGHYFDIGAAQMIIDGLIKLKNDSPILEFDESGLKFADGSHVDADAVICATGCGDMRGFIRKLCGDVVADECPPLIGVDEEGEMTWFRPLPRKGLWYMHGSLSLTRFYSKHVAMYIKAMEQNLITSRYASELGPNCIRLR